MSRQSPSTPSRGGLACSPASLGAALDTPCARQAAASAAERAARLGRPVLLSVACPAPADLCTDDLLRGGGSTVRDGCGYFASFANPAQKTACAASGAAWSTTFSGNERFQRARDAAAAMFADAVFAGDERGTARVFCAFNFEDEAAPGSPFAPATLFLPRLQFFRASSGAFLTPSTFVSPGTSPEDAALSLRAAATWNAGAPAAEQVLCSPFTANPSAGATSAGAPVPAASAPATAAAATELGGDWFEAGVSRALAEIAAGRAEKVVLARAWRATLAADFRLCHALRELRKNHPRCTTFAFGRGALSRAGTPAPDDAVFFGATPELLLEVQNGMLRTEALAGTAARGATPAEDAAFTAALLSNPKELCEHDTVVRAILAALRASGIGAPQAGRARAARFNGVQHLWTPITAALPAGAHILELARALHPTPALGGVPRETALALIRALEPLPRGPYAGLVGWFDATGAGRLHVSIRAALLASGQALFHAGAGVVAGAAPAAELRETDRKAAAIREALGAG